MITSASSYKLVVRFVSYLHPPSLTYLLCHRLFKVITLTKDIWEPENGEMLELKRERVELHTSLAGSTMMLISNLAEAHRSSIVASLRQATLQDISIANLDCLLERHEVGR